MKFANENEFRVVLEHCLVAPLSFKSTRGMFKKKICHCRWFYEYNLQLIRNLSSKWIYDDSAIEHWKTIQIVMTILMDSKQYHNDIRSINNLNRTIWRRFECLQTHISWRSWTFRVRQYQHILGSVSYHAIINNIIHISHLNVTNHIK